jgi:hypothetical protein
MNAIFYVQRVFDITPCSTLTGFERSHSVASLMSRDWKASRGAEVELT